MPWTSRDALLATLERDLPRAMVARQHAHGAVAFNYAWVTEAPGPYTYYGTTDGIILGYSWSVLGAVELVITAVKPPFSVRLEGFEEQENHALD